MAINQANIFIALEALLKPLNKSAFIYGFLDAYGYSKATITRLQGNDSRNIAAHPECSEVAFKKGVYFKPVDPGHDIHAIADLLKTLPSNSKNGIRFVIVTDWVDVVAYDLKADERLECLLTALPENYTFFLPLAGFEKAQIYSENPADVKAAEQMGRLFDLIKERNPPKTQDDIHVLNVFLTRLLFCFFAEDTGIFAADQISSAIASFTSEDGSDVAKFYTELFEVLNEPDTSAVRHSKPAYLKAFPYVNGGLFRNKLPIPEFGAKARRILLDCGALQWSEINPDIFGSMFQSVIDEDQRGNLGQHYTSVTNIMKVIQPLFLDKLEAELEASRSSEAKLKQLLDRISRIKVFDPACGSGNFLIIAYKELRKIEMAIFKALDEVSRQKVMFMSSIKLSQFYGIEIDDFAHEIALLSLWLTEHQMNQAFRNEFGYTAPTLPLKESGNIMAGNSLRLEWSKVCPKSNEDEVYICGNPPFLGAKNQDHAQKEDMEFVFGNTRIKNYSSLDYIACWIYKAVRYLNGKSSAAFVSTSSICQGEQVAILWPTLLESASISFAYQPFKWTNNAKNVAAVFCVIVGLERSPKIKTLFNNTTKQSVNNISPYLLNSGNYIVKKATKPINGLPLMGIGNKPIDDGNYLFSKNEMLSFLGEEPAAQPYFYEWFGADELMNSKQRWCLLTQRIPENEFQQMPLTQQRVDLVKQFRLKSDSKPTQKLAEKPRNFHVENFPTHRYLVIPKVSSDSKKYIPVALFSPDKISSDLLNVIDSEDLYVFGLISSEIHMLWVSIVGGRFGNGFRYSSSLCYNTFPTPKVEGEKRKHIEMLAEEIILIREDYPEKNLSQLYAPDLMPAALLAAHKSLDAAVEKLYREKPFKDSSEKLEHLFTRYEKLVSGDNKNLQERESGWLI